MERGGEELGGAGEKLGEPVALVCEQTKTFESLGTVRDSGNVESCKNLRTTCESRGRMGREFKRSSPKLPKLYQLENTPMGYTSLTARPARSDRKWGLADFNGFEPFGGLPKQPDGSERSQNMIS